MAPERIVNGGAQLRPPVEGAALRADDARGAIKIAKGGVLLEFWREVFLLFGGLPIARNALFARNKIADCWGC
jgi:hypothetical protein